MAAGNVKATVTGDKLVIEVDLAQNLGPSTSGKSDFVANTGGFTPVEDHPGMKFSLNVIKPRS